MNPVHPQWSGSARRSDLNLSSALASSHSRGWVGETPSNLESRGLNGVSGNPWPITKERGRLHSLTGAPSVHMQ